MWINEISNLEALAFIGGVLAFAILLGRLVPAADGPPPRRSW